MSTCIITHDDTDGICSGAIALAVYPDAEVRFSNPYRLLYDLRKLENFERIIICDLSIIENKKNQILSKYISLSNKKDVIYIDHHKLPESIKMDDYPGTFIHSKSSSASELAYNFFRDKLDILHARTAIYGSIADYLDNAFSLQTLLRKWDKRTLYFEAGILSQAIDSLGKNDDLKKKIVNNLAKNIAPSQIVGLVDRAVKYTEQEWQMVDEIKHHVNVYGNVAYSVDYPFSLGKTATILCGMKNIKIGVAGKKRGNLIDLSLRTWDETIDLNYFLRRICLKYDGTGGGHAMAAGARIPEMFFQDFVKILDDRINE